MLHLLTSYLKNKYSSHFSIQRVSHYFFIRIPSYYGIHENEIIDKMGNVNNLQNQIFVLSTSLQQTEIFLFKVLSIVPDYLQKHTIL